MVAAISGTHRPIKHRKQQRIRFKASPHSRDWRNSNGYVKGACAAWFMHVPNKRKSAE
jgi:hypothetical protein